VSDNLADRLRQKAEAQRTAERAERDQIDFQNRVNTYISENAQREYDCLVTLLQQKAIEVNKNIGDLPQYEWQGMMLQQGNCVASMHFSKPFTNAPENRLQIGIGTHPHALYFDAPPPQPIRITFHAAARDDLGAIVWVGNHAEMSSDQLVEFILENLTEYYLKHKPRS
jgi:hypothetical protein